MPLSSRFRPRFRPAELATTSLYFVQTDTFVDVHTRPSFSVAPTTTRRPFLAHLASFGLGFSEVQYGDRATYFRDHSPKAGSRHGRGKLRYSSRSADVRGCPRPSRSSRGYAQVGGRRRPRSNEFEVFLDSEEKKLETRSLDLRFKGSRLDSHRRPIKPAPALSFRRAEAVGRRK